MSTEKQKVDVLAAMRRALCKYKQHEAKGWNEMSASIDVVDELINAVKHLRSCCGDEHADPGSPAEMRLDAAKDRVDEALTRIGGAS